MSDEEVIKRRLLIDGDGTGDDRRLNVLLKTFIKWCNSTDSTENCQTIQDRMLAQLAQCEFAMKKSDFSANMMKQELKNYSAISETIETGIELAKQQIEQSKESLILAKKIRKNRMEYDVLAKIIQQQPDRKNTINELETLKNDLNQLEEKRKDLDNKLEMKKKEFTVLMRSIMELQNKLELEDVVNGELSNEQSVDDEDKMSCDGEVLSPNTININFGDPPSPDISLSSPEKN
uniref:Putative mrna processing n=1 Tax=Corethrella appendiculata TaxID=1370023 RepID=U5EWJ7_9DIPT